MSTPPPPSLDPVSAATSLAAILLSPALAAVVGHYAVIIVASVIGGAWALGRRDPTKRGHAVVFLLLISGTAAMLTTGLAVLASGWLPAHQEGVSWLVAPIGLLIGGIGHDWPRVGRWLAGRAGRLIDRRIDRPQNDDSRDEWRDDK